MSAGGGSTKVILFALLANFGIAVAKFAGAPAWIWKRGLLLAIEIKSLIIGEAPALDFRPFIENEVAKHLPEGKVLRLLALQTGANEVLLSYKIHPGLTKDVHQLVTAINEIERATKKRFPVIRRQFVEPDFYE